MTKRATLLAAVVVVLVGGASCSSDDEGSSDETTTTTTVSAPARDGGDVAAIDYEPTLEPRECDPAAVAEVPEGIDVECSWLVVPADRSDPDGGDLRLAVSVLPSTAAEPAPDPMVFVSGGPGGDGGEPNFWAAQPFVETRDVVLWDQRGTGASEPDMDCPGAEDVFIGFFTAERTFEEDRELLLEAFENCRDRLMDEGIDLEAFSTPISAADLADLRVALGYDEWNLYGLSYGTRLSLETMRSYPEGIRSVVLDSAYPMDNGHLDDFVDGAQHGIDQLVAGCAADPACAAEHADLGADIDAVVEQYDADPHRSTIEIPGEGTVDIVLTGQDILAGLYEAVYGHELIPLIPGVVTSLLAGDSGVLDTVAAQSIPAQGEGAEAMAHLTACADSAPVRDADPDADAAVLDDPGQWAAWLLFVFEASCEVWPSTSVDASFFEPVTVDIPVLILAGTYDPATPLPGAQEVADDLPDATLVTFEGHGHGLWNDSECAIDLADRFFADPTGELDTTCADELEPPTFG